MFNLAKKIISAKQLKTYRAKNSSAMKEFVAKGGGEIVRRKIYQKELWGALRDDSKTREVGERALSKKGMIKFLGKLFINDKDHLTRRKVKKIAGVWGVTQGKLFRAVAEARVEQNKTKIQERQIEEQKHQQQRIETQADQQQRAAINDHINQLISKGHEKARASFRASSSVVTKNGDITHADNYHSSEWGNNDIHENVTVDLGVSDNNIRKYENSVYASHSANSSENHSKAFGHVLYRGNLHADYAGIEDEKEDAKARLARIQAKADNYDNDIENKIAA